jgi:hypothetical protein
MKFSVAIAWNDRSGSIMIKALGYKPEFAGVRPNEVNDLYQFTSSFQSH